MLTKENTYALVLWPWSQEFIGNKNCYFYNGNSFGEFDMDLSQAVFVPEKEYEKTLSHLTDGISGRYTAHEMAAGTDAVGPTGLSYDEDDEDEIIFVEEK